MPARMCAIIGFQKPTDLTMYAIGPPNHAFSAGGPFQNRGYKPFLKGLSGLNSTGRCSWSWNCLPQANPGHKWSTPHDGGSDATVRASSLQNCGWNSVSSSAKPTMPPFLMWNRRAFSIANKADFNWCPVVTCTIFVAMRSWHGSANIEFWKRFNLKADLREPIIVNTKKVMFIWKNLEITF